MKNGKQFQQVVTILILATVTAPAIAFAQANGTADNPGPVVVKLSQPSQPPRIVLQTEQSGIDVHGYNGNEVTIQSAGQRGNLQGPKNMRRLYPPRGFTVDEANNVVTIHAGMRHENLDIQVPMNSALSLKTTNGQVQVNGVFGELELETANGRILLENVGGSIVAHTTNGYINAAVARLDTKPSSFSTFNGRVNVTLPANVRANLTMRSDRGDVYIDQDYDYKELPLAPGPAQKDHDQSQPGMVQLQVDSTIHGAINGGGVEIGIRTYNGGIYVHKGK